MLTIKLSRIGKKNQPMYRLVIGEKSKDPYGKALELLGNYNPFTKALNVKGDRIKYWLSKGAQLTPTVNNLLVNNQIIEGKKVENWSAQAAEKKTAKAAVAAKSAEVAAAAKEAAKNAPKQ